MKSLRIPCIFILTIILLAFSGCENSSPTVYQVNASHKPETNLTEESHEDEESHTEEAYTEENNNEQGYKPGMVFPDFTMTDAEGTTVNLNDYRGKALYLNFFTTWCVYCYYEMPDLAKVAEKYADDMQVLLVDIGENAELAKEYADTYNIPFNINNIPDWNVGTHVIEGVPESFVLDKDGVIVDHISGMAKYEWMEAAVSNAVSID